MMKRCTVLIMTLTLLFSTVAAQGTEQDGAATQKSQYGEMLNALGVLDNYGEANFNDQTVISRAQTCMLIVNVFDMKDRVQEGRENTYFYDVPFDHWALEEINTLYLSGITSGDEAQYFYPDRPITCIELAKMILCAMDYGAVAENLGGYPFGYTKLAAEHDFFDGLTLNYQDQVTGYELTRIIYNILDMPFANLTYKGDITVQGGVPDYTILSMRDIAVGKGQIVRNSVSSLVPGGAGIGDGNVEINAQTYLVGETDIEAYLGCYVKYYYQDNDGVYTIKYYELSADAEDMLRIQDKNILDASNTYIKYVEDGSVKEKTTSLAQGATLVYNGTVIAMDPERLSPENGLVLLIDSKTPGKSSGYDVVYVTEYHNLIVGSVDAIEMSLTFTNTQDESLKTLDCSDAKTKVLYNGGVIPFSDLKRGDSVALEKSADGNAITIHLINRTVSGELQAIGEDFYEIAGKSYEICKPIGMKDNMTVQAGKKGVFYLDMFGRIFYADVTGAEGVSYGFIFGCSKANVFDYMLKIFNGSGETEVLMLADRVRLKNIDGQIGNDQTYTNAEAGERIMKFIQAQDSLVAYEQNMQKEITSIELPVEGSVSGEMIDHFSRDYIIENTDVQYSYGRCGQVHLSNTQVFVISKGADGKYAEDYCRITTQPYNDGYTLDKNKDRIEFYDVSLSGIPKAGLVVESNSSLTGVTLLGEYTPVIVDGFTKVMDDEGSVVEALRGYQDGVKKVIHLADIPKPVDGSLIPDIKQAKKGDMLVFEPDFQGKIDSFYVFYTAAGKEQGQICSRGGGYVRSGGAPCTVYSGTVSYVDDNSIRLQYNGNEYASFLFKLGNAVNYIEYTEGKDNPIRLVEKDNIVEGERALVHANRNDVVTVFIMKGE